MARSEVAAGPRLILCRLADGSPLAHTGVDVVDRAGNVVSRTTDRYGLLELEANALLCCVIRRANAPPTVAVRGPGIDDDIVVPGLGSVVVECEGEVPTEDAGVVLLPESMAVEDWGSERRRVVDELSSEPLLASFEAAIHGAYRPTLLAQLLNDERGLGLLARIEHGRAWQCLGPGARAEQPLRSGGRVVFEGIPADRDYVVGVTGNVLATFASTSSTAATTRAWMSGATNASHRGRNLSPAFRVASGQATALEFTVGGAARLVGRVAGDYRERGCQVRLLQRVDRSNGYIGWEHIDTAEPPVDERFVFDRLPPGDYRVAARWYELQGDCSFAFASATVRAAETRDLGTLAADGEVFDLGLRFEIQTEGASPGALRAALGGLHVEAILASGADVDLDAQVLELLHFEGERPRRVRGLRPGSYLLEIPHLSQLELPGRMTFPHGAQRFAFDVQTGGAREFSLEVFPRIEWDVDLRLPGTSPVARVRPFLVDVADAKTRPGLQPRQGDDGAWHLTGGFGAAALDQIFVASAETEDGRSYVYSAPLRPAPGERSAIHGTMFPGCEAELRWQGTPPGSFSVRVALDPAGSRWLNLPGRSLEGTTATAIGLIPDARCQVVPGNHEFRTGAAGTRTAVTIR